MNALKKWWKNLEKEKQERKQKQDSCKHIGGWFATTVTIEASNHSLIGILVGPTKIYVKADGQMCKECEKLVIPQIDVD